MEEDFKIFCARIQDVNFPTACIKLKGQEDNTSIFTDAESIKISKQSKPKKYCYIQLQKFDHNYREHILQ